MNHPVLRLLATWLCGISAAASAALTPEQLQTLPPPAGHAVNFTKEIKPILEGRCANCHGHGRDKGRFRMDTRETFLKGGGSGEAIVVGKSAESYLIELVMGFDPDNVMPKKGTKLSPEQVSLLRAWIDQGAKWDEGVSFARAEPRNLHPRRPELPATRARDAHPIDRLLEPYFAEHKIKPGKPVDDRVFARRAYLDVLGLLPPPEALEQFLTDKSPDKRRQLVRRLLADSEGYAVHWLSFWNDMLRNDYKGTGYIDGGRKQITQWLYSALETNKPYKQFVAELVNPTPASEGFTKGIVWRGVVNASQTPPVQAAQSVSQVFMGVNLKCASCHDSFVNSWMLSDAYGLASVYADNPLEMVECDKPTGKTAAPGFIYPQLGQLPASTNKAERLDHLAKLITKREDGRLPRTLVNRLWQKFFGRGLVEPLDDMEQPAWNSDLLDWLAEDFADHGYDVKYLIETMLTSRAYQLPAVPGVEELNATYVFTGPQVRRLTAEQYRDALTMLTGVGYAVPAVELRSATRSAIRAAALALDRPEHVVPKWIWNNPEAAQKAKTGPVFFRKDFWLEAVPTDAVVVMASDNGFVLYVNGQRTGAGDEFQHTYVFDIREHLRPGENYLMARAVNHLPGNVAPKDDADVPGEENPAGLLLYARLRNGTNALDFGSDATWLWSARSADVSGPEPGAGLQPVAILGDSTIAPWEIPEAFAEMALAWIGHGKVRAGLVKADPLQVALGRPNREQVITSRSPVATTLQALELTNGSDLAEILARGAEAVLAEKPGASAGAVAAEIYQKALGRKPTASELRAARELLGKPVQKAGVEDLMWALTMLPEFQLIY